MSQTLEQRRASNRAVVARYYHKLKTDDYDRYCRERRTAQREANRRYWHRHAAELRQKSLEYHYLRRYKMTITAKAELLIEQGGRCLICKTSDPGKMGWHIDHNHRTGIVRGILCGRCNAGLGYFNDNPSLVMEAASYLLRHYSVSGVLPSPK